MIPTEFKSYKKYTSIFFETGTYHGAGVINAINSGFFQIYSVELDDLLYKENVDRFKLNSNVNIIHGDSSVVLYDSIKNINESIFFWLDGHYSGGETAQSSRLLEYEFPILYELEQINRHNIKTHIILIDDLRLFPKDDDQDKQYNYSIEIIKNKILEINTEYKFEYIDGYVPNDILYAYI